MDKEHFENIKARLKSFRCSYCHGWLTPKDKRPPTCTDENQMCSCGSGIHACKYSDVNEDDVEWLVNELEKAMNKC